MFMPIGTGKTASGEAKRKSVIVVEDDNNNVRAPPEDYATEAIAPAAAEAEFARTQRVVTALKPEVRDDPTTDQHRTYFQNGGK